MNIVYGFGGLRSDGDILSLSPSIPESWEGYKFRIVYDEKLLSVEVKKDKVALKTLQGGSIRLSLYKNVVVIDGKERVFEMPS